MSKPSKYFNSARDEILPYLPQSAERVLELGCGTGATINMLKEFYPNLWSFGVEYEVDVAEQAKSVLTQVVSGDVETLEFEKSIDPASLDLVLCLDVLEHLRDPWAVVQRFSPLLKPEGRLIISIPNIRHYKFIWRLLTKADFNYTDAGLLDKTHLRFFVRHTASALATCGGLELVSCNPSRPFKPNRIHYWLSKLTGGKSDDFFIKQFVLVAKARR